MRTFEFGQGKTWFSAVRHLVRPVDRGRGFLSFCNENMILFAVVLLAALVAAILVAWFQWQAQHAEFGVFISQGY